MRYKSFQQLPKIKIKNPNKAQSQSEPTPPEPEQPDTEQELFEQHMQGVEPLRETGRGREVHLHTPPRAGRVKPGRGGASQRYLQDLIEGRVEFEIEWTKEYLQGNVLGLDPKIFRKLKSGQLSPEAHLDLHGFTTEQALIQLILFVKDHYLSGRRCLLIIPGRGKNSPHGKGVLREEIQAWLTRDPLRRVVLAFSTAQPQHGGAGALYILLRKFKKSRGKVFWERTQFCTEEG
jgi:DNA-nicking Smr family endonuclease